MRLLRLFTLAIPSFLLVFCSNKKIEKRAVISFNEGVDNYGTKRVVTTKCFLNDSSKVIFFKDSIDSVNCAVYLKTDIELNDFIKTLNNPNIEKELKDRDFIILINDIEIHDIKIKDSHILLPTYISSFRFKGNRYTILSFNLISFMRGDYWYTILINKDKAYSIESANPLAEENFGDYNKDGKLDYSIKKSVVSQDLKKNESFEIYTLPNVKIAERKLTD